jgi:hypothetical protein
MKSDLWEKCAAAMHAKASEAADPDTRRILRRIGEHFEDRAQDDKRRQS